jgi:hypothetical protein
MTVATVAGTRSLLHQRLLPQTLKKTATEVLFRKRKIKERMADEGKVLVLLFGERKERKHEH